MKMAKISRAGFVLLIISLSVLLFGAISTTNIVEYGYFRETSDYPSREGFGNLTTFESMMFAFIIFFPIFIFPAACVTIWIGLTLILLRTKHPGNFINSLIGLIMWTLFMPIGLSPFLRFSFDLGSFNSIFPAPSLYAPLLFWINISIGLPLYKIGGKPLLKIGMVIIVFCSFWALIFSFVKSEHPFAITMELAFLSTIILQLITCIKVIRWIPELQHQISEKERQKWLQTHQRRPLDPISKKESPLENETTREIIRFIIKHPGCTLEDLSKKTGLNLKMLDQHIDLLSNTNILKRNWDEGQVMLTVNDSENIIRILYMTEMDG
jgi:hypothetical protein